MNYIPSEVIRRLHTLSSEEVAKKLGMRVFRHKTQCFMHDDKHPSLSFFGSNKERWNCFVCDKGGSAISLVMAYYKINFRQACEWLCSQYGIYYSHIPNRKIIYSRPNFIRNYISNESYNETGTFNKEIAEWIIKNASLSSEAKKFLFEERRLNPNVITELKIGSISNSRSLITSLVNQFDTQILLESGFMTQNNGRFYFRLFVPCLIFPYYDINGNLIGLQSRYLGTQSNAPRFQFISRHKVRLFNLPIIHKLQPGNEVYISEGITDCFALLSAGYNALAIPSATILPKDDLRELKQFKIYMYPDRDKTGEEAFYKLRDIFINMGANIQMKELPQSFKDFGEYYCKQHE